MDALSRLAFALLICVATVACVAAQATPAVTRCNVDDFVCDSGVCIWLEWRCDGLDDCGDDSDEQNCDTPDRKCRPTSERRCPDGMCVLKKEPCTCLADQQRCDNGNCVAMSDRCPGACRPDERMCPNVTCVAAGALCPGECADFRCDDGTCLDAAFICDSVADCADAADERNCTADRECTREQFACADGGNATCIRAAWRCDGTANCADGGDEVDCPLTLSKGQWILIAFSTLVAIVAGAVVAWNYRNLCKMSGESQTTTA